MFAIIESGGKQYRVEEGDSIRVEKLKDDSNTEIKLNTVMLVGDGDKILVGKPYVDGASVTATKLCDDKEKKVIVYKYKRRKDWDRKMGHRQQVSVLRIDKINF